MDLNIAVWNIRGMSTSDKQKEVRKLIKEENLQLCSIIETHIRYQNIMKVSKRVFDNWEFSSNGKDNVETICLKIRFYCTIVYASNSYDKRRKLWKELENQKIIASDDPWVVIGDFNVTLKVKEHSNGSSVPSCEMTQFNDYIRGIEIKDILSSGFEFTWTKSRNNPLCKTLKKLDRIMINEKFIKKFPNSHGIFMPYMISDHSPAVLRIPKGMERRRKAFRFSNFITDKKEFILTVREAWKTEITGHMMYRIVKKMKLIKKVLNDLSWKDGNIFERVTKLRESLKESQTEVDKHPHCEIVKEKSCKLLSEYYEALKDESNMLMQKAKVDWLKDGDRNTKLFHKIIKSRMHKEFLGNKDVITKFPTEKLVFPNKISVEEGNRMCKDVCDAEVKNTMFNIDDNKAPGPDGYTARFYKSAWSVIGKDICKAVKEFFKTGRLLGEIIINRLKGVLGNLVLESQSTFIAERQISDNILLAQELFKGYNRKQNARKVAFKIDFQKAYDTISWDFIEVVLKQFGFPKKMVDWIMANSMTSAEQNIILGIVPFAMRKLPVRYLGVPLITKKTSSTNCKILIDKVRNRVLDWRNKALSYSGRLQLISSVLSAMQIYWASVFLLPKNEVNANANSSAEWKEMLRLRDKIRKHVLWKIGDGKDINTWYDNWNIHGPLCADITSREIYDAGLSIETNIADFIMVCKDNWPEGWLDEFLVLHQYGFSRILNNRKNTIVWVNKEGNEKLFSINNIWKDMEVEDGKVDWYNVIWFNKNIPRHAFVLWMALQGRLSTQDRIATWKPNDVMQCGFYEKCLDSVEHLFFSCAYPKNVWRDLQNLLNVNLSFN
ncbi:RNA-directed DNA polymerase, eukaryota, reverse transcriptase zinc-binding domain protein [Tanacetum coccineum]